VKNYILDTNVLLHDPNSLLSFKENWVLIPIEVLEEIARFKRESSELGQNARSVARTLDGLRAQGRLSEGVIVARPTIPPGKELGFLPGTLEEKLTPWMQPIHDTLGRPFSFG